MDLCDSPIDWVPFENFSFHRAYYREQTSSQPGTPTMSPTAIIFLVRLHTQNLKLLAVLMNYFFHDIDIRLHCFHSGNSFLIPFGGRYIILSQKPELWLDIILNIKLYIPYVIPDRL